MLDNDPEMVAYRERTERRLEQRRHGVRRRHAGRRRGDVVGTLKAAFPPEVLIMFLGLVSVVVAVLLMI